MSESSEEARPLPSQTLRGYALVAEVCAEALLNEPTPAIIEDVRRVAQALGDTRFDDVIPDAELRQRYYDRLFVSSSPYYVPLVESSITKRVSSAGRLIYGPMSSARGDHVLACYREVGFDYHALRGYDMATRALRPDSLAAELAFLAALARAAATRASGSVGEGAPARDVAEAPAGTDGTDGTATASPSTAAQRLLADFLRRHTAWFPDAAACLAAGDDDFYARLASLAAEATRDLAAALG